MIITLMKKKFVDEYHWIDEEEMLDLVAIAQSAPGPIAVNGAIVIGYKLAGVPGLLVSILGTVTPPFVILSIVSLFYTAFRENLYIAMIASVVYDMGEGIVRGKKYISILIMVLSFIAVYFLNISAVYIILACGVLGAVRTLLAQRGGKTS